MNLTGFRHVMLSVGCFALSGTAGTIGGRSPGSMPGMNRLALLVTFMIAGAIPMSVGCASRQKKSDVPAQAAIDHQPAASSTVASQSAKADPPAGDPPAGTDPPAASLRPASLRAADPPAADPPAGDPPAADPATIASAAGQASGDAPASQPEIMGAASADGDLGDADIIATQKPSGSIVGKAIRATPGVAADVVLAPFRFVWRVLKKNYTAEGLAKSQTIELNGKTVSIIDYNEEVNKSKKPRTLYQKTRDAAAAGYNYTEKTVFLPFQFLDSAVGAIFMPF